MNKASTVHLTRLNLTNFRNYEQLSMELDGRHVVLTGENGAGKTNLLEAISFLSPGRGMRRAAYADVPREGTSGGFTVFAALEGMAGPVEIGTTAGEDMANGGGGRRLRINGTNAKSADELLDHLRLVWLTPAMDGLFTGPAGDRRRFLDRQVLAIDPSHGKRVLDYEKAMRSRNRLLSENRMDPVWLDGIELQMAELAMAIATARRELVSMLAELIENGPEEVPFPRASLTLQDFIGEMPGANLAEQEEAFARRLSEERYRDAAAGRTLIGPHRSDLLIRHVAKDMDAARCSTGEQKALLIGLVLAHARLTGSMSGYPPILLMDEIAAHLDEGRRAALFDLIDDLGGQAFLTGTDAPMFQSLGDRAQNLFVHGGQIDFG